MEFEARDEEMITALLHDALEDEPDIKGRMPTDLRAGMVKSFASRLSMRPPMTRDNSIRKRRSETPGNTTVLANCCWRGVFEGQWWQVA